jgi:hypothetical protein
LSPSSPRPTKPADHCHRPTHLAASFPPALPSSPPSELRASTPVFLVPSLSQTSHSRCRHGPTSSPHPVRSFHYGDQLVEALARKLSITSQYFVGDLSDLNTYGSAKSVADAHRIVDAIIAQGDRPAVGFMACPAPGRGVLAEPPTTVLTAAPTFRSPPLCSPNTSTPMHRAWAARSWELALDIPYRTNEGWPGAANVAAGSSGGRAASRTVIFNGP